VYIFVYTYIYLFIYLFIQSFDIDLSHFRPNRTSNEAPHYTRFVYPVLLNTLRTNRGTTGVWGRVSPGQPSQRGSKLNYIDGKVHPTTGHEGPEGEYRYSSTLSLTPALNRREWSKPRPGRLTPGKENRYPLHRTVGGNESNIRIFNK
jgi:hypothetical protein